MKWPRTKVRVRDPNPLQKLRALPRFKMTQLRQGKQRPKTFLPLNRARKKSLLLQPKSEADVDRIRFLIWQSLDFTRRRVSHVRGFGFLIAGTIHTCSIAARARLWIWRLRFFFLIAGTIHTCFIAARAILARLLLEQDYGFGVFASSSFSSPVPSVLSRLLLEQDYGFIVHVDCFL